MAKIAPTKNPTAKPMAPKVSKATKKNAAPAALVVGERAKPVVAPSVPSRHLDVFPNPAPERDYVIQFQVPEFTCHCPLTGQPDFAHFTIDTGRPSVSTLVNMIVMQLELAGHLPAGVAAPGR